MSKKGEHTQPCGCVSEHKNGDNIIKFCDQHFAEYKKETDIWEYGYEGHGYWGKQE